MAAMSTDSQCQTLASGFSQFFVDKLARIRQSIAASLLQSGGSVSTARQHTGPTLSLLAPTSAPEVLKLLTSRPVKSSPVDVLPSVLLRSCDCRQSCCGRVPLSLRRS